MIERAGGGGGAWLSLLDQIFLCLDLLRCAWKGAKCPMKSPAHLPSKHTRKPRTTEPSSFAGGVDAYVAAGALEVSLPRPRLTELLNCPCPSLRQPAHGLSLDSLDIVGWV